MTKQKDLKRRIRARMAKTDESYTTARRHLLAQSAQVADPLPGLLPGYTRCGGEQADTAVLCNVFAQSAVENPHTNAPYSEALLAGLCGGVGFMYMLFEYAGYPPALTLNLRSFSYPDRFTEDVYERAGVDAMISTTGSARVARRALDDVLAQGRSAICTLDLVSLPDSGLPAAWAGQAPGLAGIAGVDGDRVWIDRLGSTPRALTLAELAQARAAYKKGKNRLITVAQKPWSSKDLAAGVRAALAATVRGYREAPFKGYANNFGLLGLEKWHRLLTDERDKKGWRRIFDRPAFAHVALRRVYECIRYEYTGPDAGRPLYATYLREAAEITGDKALVGLAERYDEAGAAWRAVAEMAVALDDETLARDRALTDQRQQVLRAGDAPVALAGDLWREREQLAEQATLALEDAHEVFALLAEQVATILELERGAVEELAALSG